MVSKSRRRKIRRDIKPPRTQNVKITVYLSGEAKKNLELLRLRRLDREGRKPSGSQIIESLLKAVVAQEKIPYAF